MMREQWKKRVDEYARKRAVTDAHRIAHQRFENGLHPEREMKLKKIVYAALALFALINAGRRKSPKTVLVDPAWIALLY